MSLLTIADAKRAGAQAGRNAASWMFDGNTSDATYREFVRGAQDGDPEVLDRYAPPEWLSGELTEILGEPETEHEEDRMDGVANAYAEAADGAYWRELGRMAREALRGSRR